MLKLQKKMVLVFTPKSRFNEARFNESHDLVNKCQTFLLIPSLDLVKFHDLTNKSSLTRSFVKSRFGCTNKYKYFHIQIFLKFFQVSWIRKRDSHILTVDGTTFISDERFYILKPERRHVWTLRIRYVSCPQHNMLCCVCM